MASNIRHYQNGSRTIDGKLVSKCWEWLPDSFLSSAKPGKGDISFPSILADYADSNRQDLALALRRVCKNGGTFTLKGFAFGKLFGRGNSLYVSSNIRAVLGDELAKKHGRGFVRGVRALRGVTGVLNGKDANGEDPKVAQGVGEASRKVWLHGYQSGYADFKASNLKFLKKQEAKYRKVIAQAA